MGMIDEKRIKNRKTYTHHDPRKPLRATRTKDKANVTAQRIYIFVSLQTRVCIV